MASTNNEAAMLAIGAVKVWCVIVNSTSPKHTGSPVKVTTSEELAQQWLKHVDPGQSDKYKVQGPRWVIKGSDGKHRFINITALTLTNTPPNGHVNARQSDSEGVVSRPTPRNRNNRTKPLSGDSSGRLPTRPLDGDPRPEPPVEDGPPWA